MFYKQDQETWKCTQSHLQSHAKKRVDEEVRYLMYFCPLSYVRYGTFQISVYLTAFLTLKLQAFDILLHTSPQQLFFYSMPKQQTQLVITFSFFSQEIKGSTTFFYYYADISDQKLCCLKMYIFFPLSKSLLVLRLIFYTSHQR